MNPHVPTPSSNQYQLVASLTASPPLPSASPTPLHYYSGADPRPQISPSVKNFICFCLKHRKAFGKKITNTISPEKLP